MIQIELTSAEAELLREMLAGYHSELEMELARTSRKEYREFLEGRDRFLEDLLERLRGEMTAGGADAGQSILHA